MSRGAPAEVVFNVVWTGRVFDHLAPFVASQMAQSDARFRFLANVCPPDQVTALERFAAAHPERVVEVLEVSSDRMIRHGEALDQVFQTRHDGELFALIDPDILARRPFLDLFHDVLADHDAVTSGREVWSDHNTRPVDHPGVNGEYFFDQDGFVFGSPHLAIYRRDALADTLSRWGVSFASTGNDIPEAAREGLVAAGRSYWIYDTAKIVNILFQADGHSLVHVENPDLVHIGGVSHYLAPPSTAPAARDKPPAWGEGHDWGEQAGMAGRHAVAELTAHVLRALGEGHPAPEVPEDCDPNLLDRLVMVRQALIDMVAAHGSGPAGLSPEEGE